MKKEAVNPNIRGEVIQMARSGCTVFMTFCLCLALQLLNPTSANADTVYTITNLVGSNAVAAYDRNPETGLLTFKALYPTGGSGNPNLVRASALGALVVNGNLLYAVNPGSNNISVFRIHRNGSLELTGPPIASGGVNPVSIAISRENLLYVANRGDQVSAAGNYTGFRIKGERLAPIPNSTVELTTTGNTSQLLFSHDGRRLFGTRPGDSIMDTFNVTEDGHIVQVAELTGQAGAFAMAFNPVVKHQMVALLAHLPGSATYNVTQSGSMELQSTAIDPVAIDPCWEVVRKDGSFVWVVGFMESGISLHQIGPNGSLTFLNHHDTSTFGRFSTSITTDKNQQFMYELIPGADIGSTAQGKLHTLRITGGTADAGVADVQTVAVPQSTNPIGLVLIQDSDEDE